LEWLPVAGCIGLLARSRRGFLLIGTWFTAFLLVKGTYFAASVEDASFFRLMMPAFPAYALLAAATVLLVPGMRARPERRSSFLSGRRLTVAVSAAAAVFAVLPLGIIAATPALHDQGSKAVREGASLIPVSPKLLPAATVTGTSVGHEWKGDPSRSAAVFYRILRSNATGGSGGVSCAHTVPNASHDCRLFMDAVGATRVTTYVDRPGRGTWTYRIGASANWLDEYAYGDVYVTSPPTTVTVP
jgi:hypothetical protein